jgi:hypothetical protein
MSDRKRFLLSPYRLPTHHPVYLNEEEMASWLHGYLVLWHPALLLDCSDPPRVDSAYDHEQPVAGRAYVLPDSPPQFLPDDWSDRVQASGALRLPARSDRESTLREMIEAFRLAATTEEGKEHFGTPDQLALLDLPPETLQPFFGLGLGYILIDSLYEAMDHERLLDVSGFWSEIQQAIRGLLNPEAQEEVKSHLQAAAGKLLAAREILYSMSIYLLDIWRLDEAKLDAPPPGALQRQLPLNLMTTGHALERLAESQPERIQELRDRLDEAIQPPLLEIIGGIYQEREDALLPVESQLFNMRRGREVIREKLGTNVEVLARKKSANHPQIPAFVQATGYRRAFLVSLDGSGGPTYRTTVVNWSSPDGKSLDAFTRLPASVSKAETFFNLVYTLQQSISQDTAPTVAILHEGETDQPFYDDWQVLSQLAPVLGEWTTFSRYFSDALAGEYIGSTNADDFVTDDLEARINANRPDPISAFPRQARLRRRLDSALTLATIVRCLGGDLSLDVLRETEERVEEMGVNPIPGIDLGEIEEPTARQLAARLQGRAQEQMPGFLFLNPCGYTRRLAVELPGITGNLPIEGAIKAAQFDADAARMVVEVPPLGFAWIPSQGKSAPPKQRIRMAEENIVRNEYFEAEIDPETGGLKSFRDVRTRVARLGMQFVFNPGSKAEGRVQITQNGSALGEIVSEGVLLDDHNNELSKFRLRLRAWLTRPVLDLRIEFTPTHLPSGYPWHAYYGVRFAWRDERAAILRGVNGMAMRTDHTRPISPEFIDLKLGRSSTTILTGGLPFVQKQGSRMLDAILLTPGEETLSFDMGLALDRDYPTQLAQGLLTPAVFVPTSKGPPHIGPSGWLFQIDSPNLLLIDFRPAADNPRGFIATFLETSGVHGGSAELRCVRNPESAALLDGDDQPAGGLIINGDAVHLAFAAGELFRIRVDLA